MKKGQLIQNPKDIKPHVVLLGAGASKAALPNGDYSGKQLPLMNNLVEVLGLTNLLQQANIEPTQNFETIYSNNIDNQTLREELEASIKKYFNSLMLPMKVTDYDRLLLSLREKDAIFTFNWDPFLFEAYRRNHHVAKLPEIYFLHGNVRIGMCTIHQKWGSKWDECPSCQKKYTEVPLLYPIGEKNYSDNEYIKNSWESAKYFFANAFTITIFGYGAPVSDKAAVKILRTAWLERSSRALEHIEIVDIEKRDILAERWAPFTPTNHYSLVSNLKDSRLLQWPRRTCEALLYPMTQGEACKAFPLPTTDTLDELHEYVAEIAKYER